MASVNDWLQSEAIRHAVALQKYSNSTVAKIIAVLNRADKRLFAELTERLQHLDPASFNMERLENMLASVRGISAEAYNAVGRQLTDELRDFITYEVGYQGQMLLSALPVQVSVASVSVEAVATAAVSRPFQGVILREVWKDLDASKMKAVRRAIAQGFVESKTTDQIIRELRGTKAKGYADGLLQVTRRDAEAVVRTALGHVAGYAQDAVVEANADIVKAVRWSSTLDIRTSTGCRLRDGLLYAPGTHKPLGHAVPWLGGPGRLHWNCRSHQTTVLKSNDDLGIDVPEVVMTDSTRASMDGQLPAATSYADWLKSQSVERQNEVLGVTRAKLLRDGGLPMERMYSQKGEYLTIEQMRERDAAAFKRAGL